VLEDGGEPAPVGTGIYVHNPTAPRGNAYYAVTLVRGGNENTALSEENTLQQPVAETEGPGAPVLQRVEDGVTFNYVKDATLYYYVRWEAPPNASVESSPFNYLVATPPNVEYPAHVGIHFHCWGNHLRGGFGHWGNVEKGAILLAPNQAPYDWWTGYHERRKPIFHQEMPHPREKDEWVEGVVRPYTQNRILSFFDWMCTKWDIDRTRTFTAGNSMGGAGSLMFAIRHGDLVAWCRSQVGIHVPAHSPHFLGSYERVWGRLEFDVKFEDGNSVWDYFSDDWYLRKYPDREIGYLIFANGKNDHGIGWPQAVEFVRALQDTKRPHLFAWQMRGHGSSPTFPNPTGESRRRSRSLPLDVRTDQSLPAFTRCSLDDDPGAGTKLKEPKFFKTNDRGKKLFDLFDGDSEGQVNAYLCWDTEGVVDQPARWAMTVFLSPSAPKDSCTVDITPRRCQHFKPNAGDVFTWTNTLAGSDNAAESGQAAADEWGLVTLRQVTVSKARSRIAVLRN
jgi:pimeloyl-ACP methyl ester carboxylesterase